MRLSGAVALLATLTIIFCAGSAQAQTPHTSPAPTLLAQGPGYPAQGVVWRDAVSPFTPGPRAIMGGPGNGPEPGQPMYICRARVQGSVTPGKWLKGNCNIAFGGREMVMNQYQVAYGNASWQPYAATTNGLVRTGTDTDGTPLFSCRWRGDQGYQPGKLLDGACRYPLAGQERVVKPPFEVLSATRPIPVAYPPAYYPAYPPRAYPYPGYPPYRRYGPPPYPPPGYAPTSYPTPDPSTVTWKPAKAPAVPGPGAIQGGPGNGPNPGSPLYICRAAGYSGGLLPGKWIDGKCSVASGWDERKNKTYEVAYGEAVWGPFVGITKQMIRGGIDVDGTPLYICRVRFFSGYGDKGFQPGYLKNGTCRVPYNQANTIPPPFQVLYNAGTTFASYNPRRYRRPPPAWNNNPPPGNPGAYPPDRGNPPDENPGEGNESGDGADNSADNSADNGPQQNAPPDNIAMDNSDAANSSVPQGMRVVFDTGTGATGGGLILKNAVTGTSITRKLAPNLAPGACLKALQQAALDAGLQIQMDGDGLKIIGPDNTLSVNGADVTVTSY